MQGSCVAQHARHCQGCDDRHHHYLELSFQLELLRAFNQGRVLLALALWVVVTQWTCGSTPLVPCWRGVRQQGAGAAAAGLGAAGTVGAGERDAQQRGGVRGGGGRRGRPSGSAHGHCAGHCAPSNRCFAVASRQRLLHSCCLCIVLLIARRPLDSWTHKSHVCSSHQTKRRKNYQEMHYSLIGW